MSNLKVTIKTNKGDINLSLFNDKTPLTVSNFVNLAKRGYYNGISFHRVIDDFMIQCGCPDGDGTGGPGYQFDDEIVDELKHDKAGILSMANAGPGTNGSQFFITHVATPWLDGNHTVFGEVISDSDIGVVNSIEQNDNILEIVVDGDFDLNEDLQRQLDEWNMILSESGF